MKKFLELLCACVGLALAPVAAFAAEAKLAPFFTAEVVKKGGLGKEDLARILEGNASAAPLRVPKEAVVGHVGKIMADKFGYGQADGFSSADVVRIVRESDVVDCSWQMGQVTVYGASPEKKTELIGFKRLPYPGERCLSYRGAQYLSLRCGNTLDDKRVPAAGSAGGSGEKKPVVPGGSPKPKPEPTTSRTALAVSGGAEAGEKDEGILVERTVTLIREPMAQVTEIPVAPRRGLFGGGVQYISIGVCTGGMCPLGSPFYGGQWMGGFGGLDGWGQVYVRDPELAPGNTAMPRNGNGNTWGQMPPNASVPPPASTVLPIGGNNPGWGNMTFPPPRPGLGVRTW